MTHGFSKNEIEDCVEFHRSDLGKEITEKEAVIFLEELRQHDEMWDEINNEPCQAHFHCSCNCGR
jgi:hypothetical protein